MEGPYCNPGGGDPNNIPGCHERGVGCLSYGAEPAYFGQMGQCSTCDPEWACVSIAPGGNDGPLHADVSLTKADLQNTGRIDKSLDSIRLRESELVNLIKRVINEREREPGKPKTKPIVTFPLCCLWLCKECKPIFGKGGKLIKHGEGWKNIETGEIMYSEERPKSSVRPVGPGHTKPLTKTKGVRLENHLSRRVIK